MRSTLRKRRYSQQGFTLIEVVIASVVLIVGILGVMALIGVALQRTAGMGDQATRSAEYAQDKMEQLLALEYTDSKSDTTVYPTGPDGGKGLGDGGALKSDSVSYVDYGPDKDGQFYADKTDSRIGTNYYTRRWQIVTASGVKTIAVYVVPPKGLLSPPAMLLSQKQQY